ncbi:hypothetical protein V2J85_40560, partial [Streptomyces sp. DSM 41528]|nr:hypothetical protein [Streptomyces sp. DSM 41528]
MRQQGECGLSAAPAPMSEGDGGTPAGTVLLTVLGALLVLLLPLLPLLWRTRARNRRLGSGGRTPADAAARALAEVILARDLAGRVEVSSFHDEAVTEIARLVPGVRTVLIASRWGGDIVDRARAAGAATLALNIRRLTLETVEQAHAEG